MAAPTPMQLFKYANLQMAAEARIDLFPSLGDALIFGNNRSSKFTNALADQLTADRWVVVAHQANTSTGFSGTLFRYEGPSNPARGLINGELALSFRSTEFVDDAARDNQATNAMEVKPFGWAFGQIADMEKWVASLSLHYGELLTVTGYSLGGHLATAFNLLHMGLAQQTYTFNGAGVGRESSNVGLATTIAQFEQMRQISADLSDQFTDPIVRSLYAGLRLSLLGGAIPTEAQRQAVLALLPGVGPLPSSLLTTNSDVKLLYTAFTRIETIQAEMARVGNPPFNSGGATNVPLQPVPAAQVEATNLNYQLAVLIAARNTQAISLGSNATQAFSERQQGPFTFNNFYDVYGYTSPSAVSNSQLHYGAATPVFIEDQPLWRGDVLLAATAQSAAYLDVKLLQDNFSQNDFGDTHSLVLLVDSLAVQNALAALDPNINLATLNAILQSASNAGKHTGGGTNDQGTAEGDTLERVVEAMGKLLRSPTTPAINTAAQMEGGTWAEIDYRNTFHNALKGVSISPGFQALTGKVRVGASTIDLGAQARNDFSALTSLISLSPLVLTATTAQNQTFLDAALGSAWGATTFEQWQADRTMSTAQRTAGAETTSDRWISDRSALLDWMLLRNKLNIDGLSTPIFLRNGRPIDEAYSYEDRASNLQMIVGPRVPDARKQVVFGDEGNEALTGYDKEDHLYGGAGNDLLSGNSGADYLEGNSGADTLFGNGDNDTLLGGAGDDSLDGGTGSDDLKGAAGSDILDGGDGTDTLYGGDAADVLQGGAGNDFAYGGDGNDGYFFSPGWGSDTIEDSDGIGSIEVTNYGKLSGADAKKIGDNEWTSADGKVKFTVSTSATTSVLQITFLGADGRPISDSIRVNNWSSGNLGITLGGTVAPPVTDGTYIGDFEKASSNGFYVVRDHNYVSAGPIDSADDVITGSFDGDLILGKNGNDALAGLDGDDAVYGGDGDDFVLGGPGTDTLVGGAGNDVIMGSGRGALVVPSDPATPPPVADGPELSRGFSWVWWKNVGVDVNGFETIQGRGGDYTTLFDDGNLVDGGEGDDWLYGATGDDTIYGGEGNDAISGSAGQDTLFGDAGNDIITGDGPATLDYIDSVPAADQADDLLIGGAGRDTLSGDGGDDELYGGDDDDTLYGDSDNAKRTPFANNGNDYLDGGAGNDEMSGGGGDDELVGGLGNDKVFGDSSLNLLGGQYHGDDYIDGGDGNDTLEGGGGVDTLFGGAGNDALVGDVSEPGLKSSEYGDDYLDGEDGADSLFGGGKADTLYGGEGDDVLIGDGPLADVAVEDQGADYLAGGRGNDALVGGAKADTLIGGEGDDILAGDDEELAAADQGDDSLDGGSGADSLDGNGGNDFLHGGAGDDNLFGSAGNDYLDGGAGDDYLDGGAGDDTVRGGSGTEVMRGGAGDDTYIVAAGDSPLGTSGQSEAIVDNQGKNTVVFEGVGSSGTRVAGDSGGTLQVSVADGQSLIIQNGVAGKVGMFEYGDGRTLSYSELIGTFSETALRATDDTGSAHHMGGRNGDSLAYSAGAAIVSGGRGNDTLTGAGGNNTVLYRRGDGADLLTDTSVKVDTSGIPAPNRILFGPTIGASDLRLTGAAGALRIQVGGDPDDSITIGSFDQGVAGAAPPIDAFEFADGTMLTYAELVARGFRGDGGDDFLSATAGDDLLDGGAGDDVLFGQGGNDALIGGLGNDALTGGAGSDRYVFAAENGQDTIDNTDADVGTIDVLFMRELEPEDLLLSASGADLLIKVRDSLDRITVLGHFTSAALDRIEFGSGLVWNATDIRDNLAPIAFTEGSEDITGTSGDDNYSALGGDDTVRGLGGADRLDGGSGADLLHGGDGADTLLGGDGADQLWGEADDDLLDAGDGDDFLAGGDGSDVLIGGQGRDYLYGDSGNDSLDGGSGMDFLDGRLGQDTLDGGDGGDSLSDLYGDNRLLGGAGEDRLEAGAGNDVLDGGAGIDTIFGGDGDNTLIDGELAVGGLGNDTYVFTSLADQIRIFDAGGGRDALVLPDTATLPSTRFDLRTNPYQDGYDDLTLAFAGGFVPTMFLDRFFGLSRTPGQLEEIRFADGAVLAVADVLARLAINSLSNATDYATGFSTGETIFAFGGNDTVQAGAGDDSVDGGQGDDVLGGNSGNDRVDGGIGNDSVYGDVGNDTLDGGQGGDSVQGGGGNDRLSGGDGSDTLYGDADQFFGPSYDDGADFVDGGAGDDFVSGGGGDDTLLGGAGSDVLRGDTGNDTYLLGRNSGRDLISEIQGTDRVVFDADVTPGDITVRRDGTDLLLAIGQTQAQSRWASWFVSAEYQVERFEFAGGVFWEATTIAARTVMGSPDSMVGTDGDDIFVVDDARDTIAEAANAGTDTALSAVSYTLTDNVENLTLTGYFDLSATGNFRPNLLIGNAGNNLLTAVGTDDTLVGGAGDDSYLDAVTIVEAPDEGTDLLITRGYGVFRLPTNVENLTARPLSASFKATYIGNASANILIGSVNSYQWDVYDGGGGADTMIALNDRGIFHVDDPADVIVSSSASVVTSIDYTLAAGYADLTLIGSAAIDGIGNANANLLDSSANSAANRLAGGAGDDTLIGGSDGSVANRDTLDGGQGNDVLQGIGDNNVFLFGIGDGHDTIVAHAGQVVAAGNTLRFKAGIGSTDVVVGRGATDLYLALPGSGDRITVSSFFQLDNPSGFGNPVQRVEFADGTIWGLGVLRAKANPGLVNTRPVLVLPIPDVAATKDSAVSVVVPRGSFADPDAGDALSFTASLANGDALPPWLSFDAVALRFDGIASVFGTFSVRVTATDYGGLFVSDDFDIAVTGNRFIVGTALADVLDGATGNDTLIGLGGDDVLDGHQGNDSMVGGPGNDRFYVDSAGDTVVELPGEGIGDSIRSSVSLALPTGVEDLFLIGTGPLSGTGNSSANHIEGTVGANRIDGGGGADLMTGGAGDDTYVVDHAGDGVFEYANAGNDTIESSITWALTADVENLTLTGSGFFVNGTGNVFDNVLIGSVQSNRLDGGWGNDTLDGGAGDDELTGGLGNNVYLFGRGSGNDRITGSTDNVVTNRLSTLQFTAGVAPSDIVVRTALDLGRNSVVALELTLAETNDRVTIDGFFQTGDPANVYNPVQQARFVDGTVWDLTTLASLAAAFTPFSAQAVVGSPAADVLTGTTYAERLFGLAGNDTLRGLDGADWLDGGTGNDTMMGGTGDDVYVVDSIADVVTEQFFEGTDVVRSSVSWALSYNVENLVLTGVDAVDGTGSDTTNRIFGNAADNTLDGGRGSDMLVGGAGNDTYIVDDSYDQVFESSGEGVDLVRSTVSFTLGANIEELTLTGIAPLNGTGNTLDNVLRGNGAANTLSGEGGSDKLIGGGGDTLDGGSGDTLDGGSGDDWLEGAGNANTYLFGRGDGRDSIGELSGPVPATDNVLRFKAGIGQGDVIVTQLGTDLHFDLPASGDQVVVRSFADPDVAANPIQRVEFSDGSVWDRAALAALALASDRPPVVAMALPDQTVVQGTRFSLTIPSGTFSDPDAGDILGYSASLADGSALPAWLGFDAAGGTFNGDTSGATPGSIGVKVTAVDRQGLAVADIFDLAIQPSAGAHVISGTAGSEILRAGSTDDTINAGAGNDWLIGGVGNNRLNGEDGDDTLTGGGGRDSMAGGRGNDIYEVDSADDVVVELPGDGVDGVESSISWSLGADIENLTLSGTAETDATGNSGDNRLTGNRAGNVIAGGVGDDTLDGAGGDDLLDGGAGSDTYLFGRGSGNDTIVSLDPPTGKVDLVQLGAGIGIGDVVLTRALDDLVVSLRGGSDSVRVHDHFAGNSAGGSQIDRIRFVDGTSWGVATIRSVTNQSPALITPLVDLSVVPGSVLSYVVPTATFLDPDPDEALAYSAALADGNPLPAWLSFDPATRTFTGNSAAASPGLFSVRVTVTDSQGTSANDVFDVAVQAALDGYVISGTPDDDVLHAGSTNDTLHGGAGDDTLYGGIGSNAIHGDEGNDSLYGGGGRDTLIGSLGNDTYEIDSTDDLVSELPGEGIDSVRSNVSLVLGPDVENLTLTGSAAIDSAGNAAANVLQGNAQANRLDGQGGADTLLGAAGDDTYIVDDAGDVVIENIGEGMDSVESSVTYALGAEVETLILSGTARIDGIGNALDNVLSGNVASNRLVGNAGNDTLEGAGGADTLIGGAGDDTYRIDDLAATIIEVAGEGMDSVEASIGHALAVNVERLTLTGINAVDGTGNALANIIVGNGAANRIDGGTGADTMVGGSGDDTYVVDNGGDVVVELVGEGVDTVETRLAYTLGTDVDNLVLTGTSAVSGTGNGLANVLIGNSAANLLDAGAGIDTMIGGFGNDTYIVDDPADVVIEGAAAGTDLVRSSTSYALSANVENLIFSGGDAIDGSGNDLANTLTGNAANNVLDGGAGADKLIGGLGNDTYVVDNAGDVVSESANAGVDTIEAHLDWTLAGNVENLRLIGPIALNATGNSLANVIDGNAGANRINGGAGADTLRGGDGDDTYMVDNAGDVVIESGGGGIDAVETRLTWTLGAEIENLTLTGTGNVNATGNALDNVLTGTTGANRIDGGAGADTVIGGAGNDTYVVDDSGDVVVEGAAQGTDTVLASVSFALAAEVEKLTLTGIAAIDGTGNAAANTLVGNVGSNRLDGGQGADTMTGGLGDDTYVVDDSLDRTVEAAAGGLDTVVSSISWTLAAQLENLALIGSAAVNGTGNTAANMLTGNAASNVLNGGAGADTMTGGAGDDTYVVDNVLDVVVEAPDEGMEVVQSSVTWLLAGDFENLVLTGTRAISGTGNFLDNLIVGNSAANVIRGDAGSDRLDGSGGADTLIGGLGNDTYLFGRGYGSDLVQENDATAGNADALTFLSGISSDQIWFRHVGNDLQVSIVGTPDKATLQNWYAGAQHHVEQFATADGRSLLDSRVQELVTAMAAFTPPALGVSSLPGSYSALLPVIAAAWQVPTDHLSSSGQSIATVASTLLSGPDATGSFDDGEDIDLLLEPRSGQLPTRGWLRMSRDVDPGTDVALRTQTSGLIEAMATFSAASDMELDVLPHVFHTMPVTASPLSA